MYKTIRHGENSLQYTILPQNDDFRLEGKLKAGGSISGKKLKVKKPKRRSFFAYLGLLFVCTVLIPFLVSAECLPNPTEWFLKTKNALSQKPAEAKQNVHILSNNQTNIKFNKGNLALNVGTPVKIINKDGVEKFILKVNKSLTTDNPKVLNNTVIKNDNAANSGLNTVESSSVLNSFSSEAPTKEIENEKIIITHLNLNEANIKASTTQSITANEVPVSTIKSMPPLTILNAILAVTTASTNLIIPNRTLSLASAPNVPRASLQSSLNQNANSSSTQPTITTRIMQVPLLKSTAKKPAVPPVLVKNLSPIQPTPDTSNLNDILPPNTDLNDNKSKKNSDWIKTHWPYIDPSTYFQWNAYKTEDSVLLPALLGFALIGVILIITVCLVARNKRTIFTSVRKRNRNDLEEAGAEDNTTLLTNANLSDED